VPVHVGPGDEAYQALLDALTRDRVQAEEIEAERMATSRRPVGDVQEDLERVEREELSEARSELSVFRATLDDARARSGADGSAEVVYDSRDPVENERADVVVQYLVRPGFAEVRTEEPTPGDFVYAVRVDWARLRELARSLGHPIPL
jgi:hypothetical protein